MPEIYKQEDQKELDLNDQEIIEKILIKADPVELQKLADFHNDTYKNITLYSYFMQIREKEHCKLNQELNLRIEKNPVATAEELKLGAYIENIETHMRSVIMQLRKKGYNTFESGFYGLNRQVIGLNDNDFNDLQLSDSLLTYLKKQGIEIQIKSNKIFLDINKPLQIETIQKVWEDIVSEIPDKKYEAPESTIRAAKMFREDQEKLTTNNTKKSTE